MTRSHYINNAWQPASGGGAIPVIDPSTGETFGELARGTQADIDRAVAARARRVVDGAWGRAVGRRAWARPAAHVGRRSPSGTEELARLEARDIGKPLRRRAPTRWRSRATSSSTPARATSCTARPCPTSDGYTVLTLREPHGVTGHIIPWNYPMQIFGRTRRRARWRPATPACVKPAEEACLTVLALRASSRRGGLAGGRAQRRHRATARRRARRWRRIPGIDHLSFTGSPGDRRAGRSRRRRERIVR